LLTCLTSLYLMVWRTSLHHMRKGLKTAGDPRSVSSPAGALRSGARLHSCSARALPAERRAAGGRAFGFLMELRSTGRLVWPDTEMAKMPNASRMPHFTSVCPAGGCAAARHAFKTYRGACGSPSLHSLSGVYRQAVPHNSA